MVSALGRAAIIYERMLITKETDSPAMGRGLEPRCRLRLSLTRGIRGRGFPGGSPLGAINEITSPGSE